MRSFRSASLWVLVCLTAGITACSLGARQNLYGRSDQILGIKTTGIVLNIQSLNMVQNSSIQLTATVSPQNASDKTVLWSSSDASLATVSTSGLVTAKAASGTATITARTRDSITTTCVVHLSASTVAVTGLSIPGTFSYLLSGPSQTLTAMVTPPNASNQAVSWTSSNPALLTITPNAAPTSAVIAATNAATVSSSPVTVTATLNDGGNSFTKTCTVSFTQTPVAVSSVSLDHASLTLTVGSFQQLAPVFTQSPPPTDTAVTWTSTNSAVATVDSNGRVKGVANGTATITVTTHDGGKTAGSAVTVTTPVASVGLNKNTLNIAPGGTDNTLAVSVLPSSADQSVTWSNGGSTIVTVNSSGVVSVSSSAPIGSTAIITVASSSNASLSATCTVTVGVPVTGVAMSAGSLGLFVGESSLLSAIISPANATDTSVTWLSDTPSVATVVPGTVVSGVATATVTAVGPGSASITVTTTNGGKTASTTVSVSIAGAPPPLAGSQDAGTGGVYSGATMAVDASTTPSTPYIAYRSASGSGVLKQFVSGSWVQLATFGTSLTVAGDLSSNIALAADQGIVYVAYFEASNGNAVMVSEYNPASNPAFTTLPGPLSIGSARNLALTITPQQQPFIVYGDTSQGGGVTALLYNGSWQNFSAGISLPGTTYAAVGIDPSGTFDDSRLRAIVANSAEQFYSFPGGTAVHASTLDTSSISAQYLSLAVSTTGNLYAAGIANGQAFQYTVPQDLSNRSPHSMYGSASPSNDLVSAAVDSRTNISYTAFRVTGTNLLWLTDLTDTNPLSSTAGADVVANVTSGVPVYGVKLAMDHVGGLYLMYESGGTSGGTINVLKFNR